MTVPGASPAVPAPVPSPVPSSPLSVGEGPCVGLENGALLPFPGDCNKFLQCDHGVPWTHTCPPTLVFNPKTGLCDYLANVPSCQSRLGGYVLDASTTYCGGQPDGLYPFSGNCSQ